MHCLLRVSFHGRPCQNNRRCCFRHFQCVYRCSRKRGKGVKILFLGSATAQTDPFTATVTHTWALCLCCVHLLFSGLCAELWLHPQWALMVHTLLPIHADLRLKFEGHLEAPPWRPAILVRNLAPQRSLPLEISSVSHRHTATASSIPKAASAAAQWVDGVQHIGIPALCSLGTGASWECMV